MGDAEKEEGRKQRSRGTILFTGGGSAGHVTPNLAIIERVLSEGWRVVYAGSAKGIERSLIEKQRLPYFVVATGKLRRYFSWQNFFDLLRIPLGIFQAALLCRSLRPRIVFSKGGFVAFPIVVGAWLNRVPVIAHESDLTPGLANRLSFPFARRICVTFSQCAHSFRRRDKVVVTGSPIREGLLAGDAAEGLRCCGFAGEKPVLLVLGGGLGASSINRTVRNLLPGLLKTWQVVHLRGHGKLDPELEELPGYCQFEYLNEELAHVLACAEMVISRAGANSIYELIALCKPHILIPLSKKASRGDQVVNARYFEERGLSLVIEEETLTEEVLALALEELDQKKAELKRRLQDYPLPDSVSLIYGELLAHAKT